MLEKRTVVFKAWGVVCKDGVIEQLTKLGKNCLKCVYFTVTCYFN